MNYLNNFLFTSIFLMGFSCALWVGCQKKFDEPPPYTGPQIKANLSIRDLRAMHFNGNFEKILDDLVIEGVVVADDRQDNFYKSVILQDSTGGITLRLDGFGLYNIFPVGTRLFVKLKDLWLGDYAKMMQLGAGVDRTDPAYPELFAIPQPLFDRYLVKTGVTQIPEPRIVALSQLEDSLQSCLVSISNLEFATTDTGKAYADAINKQSVNRILKSCSPGSIYLRTSGYASFAKIKTPRGNGTLTAVYTVFRTEKQLLIRDTSDVKFNGLRCSGGGSKILFSENFETAQPNKEVLLTGWKNISETGNQLYLAKRAQNNTYAEISAFASNQPMVVSWLIMPPVNLAGSANEVLSFKTLDGFDNGAVLQVLVSVNYDGGSTPWKAKWTELKPVIAKGNTSGLGIDWQFSGHVSLKSFPDRVSIAFKYIGGDPVIAFDKRTTLFRIDDVIIEGN